MGNDLLLQFVWTTGTPDFGASDRAIDALNDDQIANLHHYDEINDDDDSIEDYRKQLKADLAGLRSVWQGQEDRHTFVLRLGPITTAVTGGTRTATRQVSTSTHGRGSPMRVSSMPAVSIANARALTVVSTRPA